MLRTGGRGGVSAAGAVETFGPDVHLSPEKRPQARSKPLYFVYHLKTEHVSLREDGKI